MGNLKGSPLHSGSGRPRRTVVLAATFASISVCALFVAYPWINSTVSDLPFFLSTGRYICENGFPYTNPFSVAEGLKIVVQQWLWDVVVYRLYGAGGYNAVCLLGIACAALACALCVPVWRAVTGGEATGKVPAMPAAAAISASLMFALPWSSVRPSIATMCFLLATVCVMEGWRAAEEDHAWRRLWALPLMVAAHMQVHMAMAWLDIAAILFYCVPEDGEAVKRLLTRETRGAELRRRLTPLAFDVISMAAMPLNPYGVDGMLYVFNSTGAASYAGAILEMQGPFSSGDALGAWHACGIATCCAAPLAVGVLRARAGKTGLRLDLAAFSLAAALMTLFHVRNGWICYVLGVPMWAWALRGVDAAVVFGRKGHKVRLAGCMAAAIPAIALSLALGLLGDPPNESTAWNVQGAYLDPVLETVEEEAGGKDAVIFCSNWTDLNWLEWRGWKVLVDARPEIWEPGISGGEEHLNCEYFDAVGAGACEFTEEGLRRYADRHGVGYVIRRSGNDEQPTATEGANDAIGWLEKIEDNGVYALYRVTG